MIQPETEVVQLESRLGRVGSIQAWNPWKSRESVAHAKFWVSKIASLSYGNESAKNPEALFESIVKRGHLSCLEFVPVLMDGEMSTGASLPANSLRQLPGLVHHESVWGTTAMEREESAEPASAFLVECPLYTRSQWMRHRSFSYLEMSRRYTKGDKVQWSYYGQDMTGATLGTTEADKWNTGALWLQCEAEYQRRLDAGWPPELARGCMPTEAMTRFWTAGFDRDWKAFVRLRSDMHAQPEIRVYSDWIGAYIERKENGQQEISRGAIGA